MKYTSLTIESLCVLCSYVSHYYIITVDMIYINYSMKQFIIYWVIFIQHTSTQSGNSEQYEHVMCKHLEAFLLELY